MRGCGLVIPAPPPARSRSSRSVGWPAAARTSVRSRRGPPTDRPIPLRGRRPGRPGLARLKTRADGAKTRPPALRDPGCPAWAGRARSPSSQHHLRIGEVVLERDAGEPFEGLDVTRACSGDNVLRKLRSRIGLVPVERLAVIARKLLVERGLWAAGAVLVGRPEPRRVRCQRLVRKHQAVVLVQTELEFRVGDEDSALARMTSAEAVHRDRDPLDLGEAVSSDELGRLLAVDVLVVSGHCLRRRREDRLRKLRRLDEYRRERVPTYRAGRLVVLPA